MNQIWNICLNYELAQRHFNALWRPAHSPVSALQHHFMKSTFQMTILLHQALSEHAYLVGWLFCY